MTTITLTRPITTGANAPATPPVPGLGLSTINNQPMLTLIDVTRANKTLSVSEQVLIFSENQLTHLDWIRIGGNATDAESGFIADFDGTVTSLTAHCENTGLEQKDITLFVDDIDEGVVGTLSGGNNATTNNQIINVDFLQGQRLRLRAVGIGGAIQDTVIKLTIKWRLV